MQSSVFSDSVAVAVADQSWLARRKDTIITVLTGVVWLVGVLTPVVADLPAWVSVVIGAVGTVAGALVNALTKGAITPSMSDRLEEANAAATIGSGSAEVQAVMTHAVGDEPVGEYVPRHAVQDGEDYAG